MIAYLAKTKLQRTPTTSYYGQPGLARAVICLVDNDVIYKLAMCNMLDDSIAALDLAMTNAYVLPTAKYKFGVAIKRLGIGERRYGAEVFARIRIFLEN